MERHERLGFSALHPRWLATVLCYESQLVYPDKSWSNHEMIPENVDLISSGWSELFRKEPSGTVEPEPVADRYADITPEDFFDLGWVPGNEEPGNGVHSLTQLSDLSLVVAARSLFTDSALPLLKT